MDETPPKDVTIHDGDVWISEVLRMTKRVRSLKETVHSTSEDSGCREVHWLESVGQACFGLIMVNSGNAGVLEASVKQYHNLWRLRKRRDIKSAIVGTYEVHHRRCWRWLRQRVSVWQICLWLSWWVDSFNSAEIVNPVDSAHIVNVSQLKNLAGC